MKTRFFFQSIDTPLIFLSKQKGSKRHLSKTFYYYLKMEDQYDRAVAIGITDPSKAVTLLSGLG